MKCWHLVAAIALTGCGLNTSALPSTGRGTENSSLDASIADSPENWPTRWRPAQLATDGGTRDTREPSASDRDASASDNGKGSAGSGGTNAPGAAGQPANGAPKPGNQAGGSAGDGKDGSAGNGDPSDGKNGSAGNGDDGKDSSGNSDADNGQDGSSGADDGRNGSSGSEDGDESKGDGESADDSDSRDHDDSSGDSDGRDRDRGSDEDDDGQSSGGRGNPQQSNDDALDGIVDLVLAILDLSLGPVRPAEIEALVSSILVLSLAPAELAGDSLIAVLDALEQTRICADHPERCNPLCTNLESDCSACGRDMACIERIEGTCKVKLPRSCL